MTIHFFLYMDESCNVGLFPRESDNTTPIVKVVSELEIAYM
jgi:hypothetical protein